MNPMRTAQNSPRRRTRSLPWAALSILGMLSSSALSQVVVSPFDQHYSVESLGSAPGVPGSYGALCFDRSNPDQLHLSGFANTPGAKVHDVPVERDVDGHILGFQGTGVEALDTPFIDGGLTYGPGGVLFYTRYPNNELGQIRPGSTSDDKIIDLEQEGITPSTGGAQFVPAGFPGAGQLKITSYGGSGWHSTTVVPDGLGTFVLEDVQSPVTLPYSMEGLAFPPPGSPAITDYSTVLLCEYRLNTISLYELDANGDPIPASRVPFLIQVPSPVGLAIDPISGDLMIGQFNGTCTVVAGFAAPCSRGASWSNYGQGWPGTLGTPTLTSSDDPVLGSTIELQLGSSFPSTTVALLMLGMQKDSEVTSADGTLHVVPLSTSLLPLETTGMTLPITLPTESWFCDVPLHGQLLVVDPGASRGFAFSEGLSLLFGE